MKIRGTTYWLQSSFVSLSVLFTLIGTHPGSVSSAEPTPAYLDAVREYHGYEWTSALPLLRALLDSIVTDEILEKTARAYWETEREDEGSQEFRSWVKGDSLPPPLSFAFGELFGRSKQSLPFLRSAVRRAPENGRYAKKLVNVSVRTGETAATAMFLESLPESSLARAYGTAYLARKTGDGERAIDLLEKIFRYASDTLYVVGSLAGASYDLGRYQDALEWYEIGAHYLKNKGDWENEAYFLGTMGRTLSKLERYEDALVAYEIANARFRALGMARKEIEYLVNAGEDAVRLARFREADSMFVEAIQLSRENGFPEDEQFVLTSQAVSLISQDRASDAVPLLLDALAGDGNGADRRRALITLGGAYRKIGRFASADSLYRIALRDAEQGNDIGHMSAALAGLGSVSQDAGRLAEAEEWYVRSILAAESAGDLVNVRLHKGQLARTKLWQGRYQDALDLHMEILPADRDSGDRMALATRLSNIADVYDFLGNYPEALRYRSEALDSTRSIGDRSGEAIELANIGLLHLKARSFKTAAIRLDEAIALAREEGDRNTESRLLVYMGQLSIETGESESAIKTLNKAIDLAQEAGNRYALSDALLLRGRALSLSDRPAKARKDFDQALRIANEMGEPYTEWLAHLRLGEDARRQGNIEEAIRHFKESILASDRTRSGIREDRLRISFQENKTRSYDSVVQLLIAEGRPEEAFTYATRGKAMALLDLMRGARLSGSSPEETEPITLQTAADLVAGDDTVLLAYWLGNEASHLWYIDRSGWSHYALPPEEVISESVRFLLERIESRAEWRAPARALGDMLLPPLIGRLHEDTQLLLSPDGILHRLPWELLSAGEDDLLSATSVVSVPSLAVLREIRARQTNRSWDLTFFGFGDPELGPESELDPIPHARREVETIESLFPSGKARSVYGVDATEQAAMSDDAIRARYLHFATHALIEPDRPLKSAIMLAPDQNGSTDGRLEVEELETANYRAELVVLSGCETGLGKQARGEGMIGFTRLFLAGGVKELVVSLWSVNDVSTSLFMKEFYEELLTDGRPAHALQKAKRTMAGGPNEKLQHPYYWAPFVAIGGS